MDQQGPPLRKGACLPERQRRQVKKINSPQACLLYESIKENMFDPGLESVEFQALKFTEFLIGRVYFLV